jgi:hypothetical protein
MAGTKSGLDSRREIRFEFVVDRNRLTNPEMGFVSRVNPEVIDLHICGDIFKFGFESELTEFWM